MAAIHSSDGSKEKLSHVGFCLSPGCKFIDIFIITMYSNVFYDFIFMCYTDGPKVRMTFWWKDVDVKKNTRVPREKFGRHSNSIYLVLKPLNKSGTAF